MNKEWQFLLLLCQIALQLPLPTSGHSKALIFLRVPGSSEVDIFTVRFVANTLVLLQVKLWGALLLLLEAGDQSTTVNGR